MFCVDSAEIYWISVLNRLRQMASLDWYSQQSRCKFDIKWATNLLFTFPLWEFLCLITLAFSYTCISQNKSETFLRTVMTHGTGKLSFHKIRSKYRSESVHYRRGMFRREINWNKKSVTQSFGHSCKHHVFLNYLL